MDKNAKEIVIERLGTMPSNMRLMIGGEGKFSKTELLQEVSEETELGELIVDVYMHGLRSFKTSVGV